MAEAFATPRTAARALASHLEAHAYNQMPKTRDWKGLHLVRYTGTDLYQWFGRRGQSVFIDPFGEPFVIEPLPPTPSRDDRGVEGAGGGVVSALQRLRRAITNENGLNGESIVCTVWTDEITTAVDDIDLTLEALSSPQEQGGA